ncbi:MAG TPA: hypothetical protein VFB13_19830 [Reyranella sp.]|nr:hypothetical protein [Reyranella sp.]
MRPAYMLVVTALACAGFGVTLARDSTLATVVFAIVAVASCGDCIFTFSRDSAAAKRWRSFRREQLNKLVAEYKEKAWSDYQKSLEAPQAEKTRADLLRLEAEAQSRAEREILEKLGPPL